MSNCCEICLFDRNMDIHVYLKVFLPSHVIKYGLLLGSKILPKCPSYFLSCWNIFRKGVYKKDLGTKCVHTLLSANMAPFWSITKRKRFFQKRNSRSDFVFEFWIKLLSSAIPVKCFIFNFFSYNFLFAFLAIFQTILTSA